MHKNDGRNGQLYLLEKIGSWKPIDVKKTIYGTHHDCLVQALVNTRVKICYQCSNVVQTESSVHRIYGWVPPRLHGTCSFPNDLFASCMELFLIKYQYHKPNWNYVYLQPPCLTAMLRPYLRYEPCILVNRAGEKLDNRSH